jgi:hypothetical protein
MPYGEVRTQISGKIGIRPKKLSIYKTKLVKQGIYSRFEDTVPPSPQKGAGRVL